MAQERITWGIAIERQLQKNDGTSRPNSVRGFAKALADETAPDGPSMESWRRAVGHMKKGRVTEELAVLIARVLGVPRSTLPAAEKVSLRLLRDRLEEVEDGISELLDGQRELLRLARLDAGESQQPDAQTP